MKLSFLFIAVLLISGFVFVSMTKRAHLLSTAIDNIEVTNTGTLVVTNYVVERLTGGPGGPSYGDITIRGTRTEAPTPNNDNGHNYKCEQSQNICYECTGCKFIQGG